MGDNSNKEKMLKNIPSLEDLMAAGVHFGHVAKYWHPKSAPFIFAKRDKIHILNLEKTQEALERVLPELQKLSEAGKKILFVGTKKQIRDVIRYVGEETGMPYLELRWLGGTLTNFEVMKSSIRRMKEIEEFLSSEKVTKYAKKERLNLARQLERMKKKFGGLRYMAGMPDVVFIVDPHYERSAIREAKRVGIPIFALLDSNSDPTEIDYVIPGNDDARKSVDLIMGCVREAILAGQSGKKEVAEEVKSEKAEVKSESISL